MEKEFPDDTLSSPYEDTASVGRTASWGSGVTWTNNHNDRGVGAYSYEYGYDKVGNRTSLLIEAVDAATEISVDWTYEYNTLNQLKKRYDGASWSGANGDTRWSYEYDKNGNLTWATKQVKASGSWNEKLQWKYEWNPRDQMERVDKFVNGAAIPVGYVVYRYCLSCDGALSEREEHGAYSGGSHPIVSWQRYEYHGLDLARVDERYDTSGGTITSGDPWRTLEVSSHRPGAIGSLLGKRVYTHTNNDATPDTTNDFFYTYDPVGNVVSVMDDSGDEVYFFTQEAFGNELPVNVLGGSDWDDAADDRIVEHQTGKWKDEFTGLYYFWARWYDPEVGRFVKRSPLCVIIEHPYTIAHANPVTFLDPTGKKPVCDQRVYEEEFNRVKTQIAPQANKRNNQAKFGSCGERALGIAKDIKQAKLCCWDVAVVTSKTKWGEGYLSCHTYHTVTVMKLIDTKARSWLDLTNRIFDDWEHQTPITGQGTLHQMGMGWFVNKFPIFVTVDDGNCRGDGTGSCWGE